MWCNDSYGVCRIYAMEAGLASQSSFLSLPLISCYPYHCQGSHSVIYAGAFWTITSDWSKHKHSVGTQNLLCYFAWSRFEQFGCHCPAYIVGESPKLLRNSFKGQTHSSIDKVEQQITSAPGSNGIEIGDRMSAVIGA